MGMPGGTERVDGWSEDRRRALPAVVGVVLVAVVALFAVLAAVSSPAERGTVPDASAELLAQLSNSVRTETSAPRLDSPPDTATDTPSPTTTPTVAETTPIDAPLGAVPVAAGDDVPLTGGFTDLIRQYFGSVTVEAIVIVQCESGFVPTALNTNTNGTQDHGLFQINDVHMRAFEAVTGQAWATRYDPVANTTFAAWLYNHAGGWGPWRCNRLLAQFDEPGE